MVITDIKAQQKKVEEALSEKRIKEALAILGELTRSHHGGNLIDEHYNLEFTYKSMLKYTVEGVNDPERQKVYNNIITSCYNLSDQLFSEINDKYLSDIFYDTRRNLASSNSDINQDINSLYAELAQNQMAKQAGVHTPAQTEPLTIIFNKLWVSTKLSTTSCESLKSLMADNEVHFSTKSLFVSALTIGALKEFSIDKILLLYDFIYNKENEVKQRAIVGLLLTLFKYDNRVRLYPEITSRLSLMQEDLKLVSNILTVAIQLIRTRETEKISKKLTDEIIPEVVKMQPNLRNKLDLDNMLGEKFNEGENPEWEDFFKDSPELMSKLEELTELQMEGADVFMNTFKMLKHFSFFNSLPNWLVPFYLENPELMETLQGESNIFSNEKIQTSLAESGFLCNSDKYSLFLSVPHMPQFQKDMMGTMFEQQLEQMDEIEKDEKKLSGDKTNSVISNRYIQDLYRFYKLHPQHTQFEDVFDWKMDFHNKWFFNELINDNDRIRQIAEFFFKKGYYEEAAEAFNLIERQDGEHLEIIQKLAYCFQQQKKYEQALNAYLKADILKPEQVWTTKKIALMYKLLKNPEKALEYYHIAERLKPEDLHTQASIGHCLLDLKNYTEALKYYFKVEYLDQSNTKVWRPIAWCSFVSGNLDQAEKYYQKLLVSASGSHDLINIGHVCWCKNNRMEALKFYQKAIVQLKNDWSEFYETFKEDSLILIKNGINKEDIPMMLDQLKYQLEE